jgi:Haem-binding domain/Cytochrome P460
MAKSRSLLLALTPVAVILGVAFIGMQFVRPELKNPPVTAELQVPPQVKQILKISCYNCHSNETQLPWFDHIAPAYWIVARDVKKARTHVNFSEIGKLPAAQQKATLYEAVNQIQLGAMPLPSYRRVHPESEVTPEQLAILKAYLKPPTPEQATPAADVGAADAQYGNWIHGTGVAPQVAPALNGLAFIPEYKNWRAISSTERFDNHTIRAILGNDIAVKAIAARQIKPWPDGATFAKVTWFQQVDDKGFARTGAFQQVELMVKDSKKYASTLGWGFGRWRGTDLKPYGKDAAFANECVGCHTPVRNSDYVYTPPFRGQQ